MRIYSPGDILKIRFDTDEAKDFIVGGLKVFYEPKIGTYVNLIGMKVPTYKLPAGGAWYYTEIESEGPALPEEDGLYQSRLNGQVIRVYTENSGPAESDTTTYIAVGGKKDDQDYWLQSDNGFYFLIENAPWDRLEVALDE